MNANIKLPINKIKSGKSSCLVFCTSPVEKIKGVIGLLLADLPFGDILFVGSSDSPFSKMQNIRFVSWKSGPFTWAAAFKVLLALRKLKSVAVILPLNNHDGRGYFILRAFCLLIGRGLATEVPIDGLPRPINLKSFLLSFRLEEKFHTMVIKAFNLILPIFRIWLMPKKSTGCTNLNGPIHYKIIQDLPQNNRPEATVVIRTYNEEKFIHQTLKAVLSQKDISKEILVIDSQSTDTTQKIARSFPVRIA